LRRVRSAPHGRRQRVSRLPAQALPRRRDPRRDRLGTAPTAAREKLAAKCVRAVARCHDGDVMMTRTQITLQPEVQRRARQRASDLGVSLAEYVRRPVARDLGTSPAKADPALVFDLGASRLSNIAKDKDAMIAEAFAATGVRRRRELTLMSLFLDTSGWYRAED